MTNPIVNQTVRAMAAGLDQNVLNQNYTDGYERTLTCVKLFLRFI